MPRHAHCASDTIGATSDTSSTTTTDITAGMRQRPSRIGTFLRRPVGALCRSGPPKSAFDDDAGGGEDEQECCGREGSGAVDQPCGVHDAR